jgi:hypothetical protein
MFNESCCLLSSYIFLTIGRISAQGIYLDDTGPLSEDGYRLQIGDPEIEYLLGGMILTVV